MKLAGYYNVYTNEKCIKDIFPKIKQGSVMQRTSDRLLVQPLARKMN